MATVDELFDSRVGIQTGLFGTTSCSLTYRVTCDNPADNPIAVLATHRDGVRIGSMIPNPSGTVTAGREWDDFGVMVREFTIVDHPAPSVWIVAAICGGLFVADPNRPWDVQVSGALDTEHINEDINGKPIGTGVYRVKPEDMGDYLEWRSKGYLPEDYTAVTKDGYVTLMRHSTGLITQGIDRTVKTGSLTLTRRLPNMFDYTVGNVLSYLNTVNAERFYGAAKGCLKFTGMDVRSSDGIMTGQSVQNVTWDVGLNFSWNPLGHQPIVLFDNFEVDGVTYAVLDPQGKWVKHEYKVYDVADFYSILSMLET